MQIKVNVRATAVALTRSHRFDFVDVNGLCCNESSIKCVFVQLTQTLFSLQMNLKAPLPESSFFLGKKKKKNILKNGEGGGNEGLLMAIKEKKWKLRNLNGGGESV